MYLYRSSVPLACHELLVNTRLVIASVAIASDRRAPNLPPCIHYQQVLLSLRGRSSTCGPGRTEYALAFPKGTRLHHERARP